MLLFIQQLLQKAVARAARARIPSANLHCAPCIALEAANRLKTSALIFPSR